MDMHKLTPRRAALFILALTLIAATLGLGPRARAQSADAPVKPAFPIPRAETEFQATLPDLQDYCAHVTKSDRKAFVVALSSYGPLDFQVRRAASPTEARDLRNFHLGVVSAMSAMPEDLAARLGQPFQHTPADIAGRKQRLVQELPQITAFVQRFQTVPQITLLAHCGFQDEFRVNDTFHMLGQTNEAVPSAVMGFVPSGQWKKYKTTQAYLDTLRVPPATFNALHDAFLPLFVVCVRHTETGGIEVIGTGIANNRCGLLFLPPGSTGPAVGQRQPDGATYTVVDPVKPGMLYFETT